MSRRYTIDRGLQIRGFAERELSRDKGIPQSMAQVSYYMKSYLIRPGPKPKLSPNGHTKISGVSPGHIESDHSLRTWFCYLFNLNVKIHKSPPFFDIGGV